MIKDNPSVLNIKTENTENTPGESVKIEIEVKKEENVVVKSEPVTEENNKVTTESMIQQKNIKTENEDDQNVKVDVTSSPTGYDNIKTKYL